MCSRVLNSPQIELAFAPGYDPALELAKHQTGKDETSLEDIGEFELDAGGPWTEHLRRKEQDWIDRIVQGKETGHYFVLLGPKVRVNSCPPLSLDQVSGLWQRDHDI